MYHPVNFLPVKRFSIPLMPRPKLISLTTVSQFLSNTMKIVLIREKTCKIINDVYVREIVKSKKNHNRVVGQASAL